MGKGEDVAEEGDAGVGVFVFRTGSAGEGVGVEEVVEVTDLVVGELVGVISDGGDEIGGGVGEAGGVGGELEEGDVFSPVTGHVDAGGEEVGGFIGEGDVTGLDHLSEEGGGEGFGDGGDLVEGGFVGGAGVVVRVGAVGEGGGAIGIDHGDDDAGDVAEVDALADVGFHDLRDDGRGGEGRRRQRDQSGDCEMTWGADHDAGGLDADGFPPGLGHEGVAGEGGVDAVVCPVLGGGAGGDGVIEHFLEGDPDGSGGVGDFPGGGAALVELGEPVVFDGAAAGDEGFADDDFGVGESGFGLLEEFGESGLVGSDGAIGFPIEFVPDVIDADEDAEDGGLKVDGVFLPAFLEIGDFMAADAAVEDAESK